MQISKYYFEVQCLPTLCPSLYICIQKLLLNLEKYRNSSYLSSRSWLVVSEVKMRLKLEAVDVCGFQKKTG